MSLQHIGEDFSSQVKLNLLPGIELPSGIYQTNIQYVTEVGGNITMHHMVQNMVGGKVVDLTYVIGRDVRSISFKVYCHNSFPTRPLVNYCYTLRIDRLILLNLAEKLLR